MLRALVVSLGRVRHELARLRRPKPDRVCATCGEPFYGFDLYMVSDALWQDIRTRAGIESDDVVCLHCASLHLGRPLRLEEFSPAPVNRTIRVAWWFAMQAREKNSE